MLDISANIVLFLQRTLVNSFLSKPFWLFISNFSVVFPVFMFLFMYYTSRRRTGSSIFLSCSISLFISELLKVIVRESRPFFLEPSINNLDPNTSLGYSFPSSHCIFFASCIAVLIYEYRSKIVIMPSMVFLFLLIISRTVLGAHYLHDCLFSSFIAFLVGFGISFFKYSHGEILNDKINLYSFLIPLIFITILHMIFIHYNTRSVYSIFIALESAMSFTFGEMLEKKYIKVHNSARVLKRAIRLLFLVATLFIIFFVSILFIDIATELFAIFVSLVGIYLTYIFSFISSKLNLFEKSNRNG